MPASDTRRKRCAVYTRKSSEEGLEQEFNSLHAQREACEAFIKSQRREGWVGLAQHYDDAGLSGATMERPALRQLLADVPGRQGRCRRYLQNRPANTLARRRIRDKIAASKRKGMWVSGVPPLGYAAKDR